MSSVTPGTPGIASQSHGQQVETPQALRAWWSGFKRARGKKDQPTSRFTHLPCLASTLTFVAPTAGQAPGIFGIPLNVSIKYANVAISLMNEKGESFIYGYVPIVVAKCGVFLKEKGTHLGQRILKSV